MQDKIIDFLDSNGIEYIDSGNNVLSGNINIACPLCSDEPSYHLGINSKGWYACWRDSSHSGKKFVNLIMQLLSISFREAIAVWEEDKVLVEESDFDNLFKNRITVQDKSFGKLKDLKLLDNFRLLTAVGVAKKFCTYLWDRGVLFGTGTNNENPLYYAIGSAWDFRIIFPIYFRDKLVSWVGRSIYDNAPIKYKDTSYDECVRHPKYCLYDYDKLMKGTYRRLYICEGLFDCFKLNSYLPNCDFATCLFTKTLREEQKSLILDVYKNFEEIRIMLDRDAEVNSYKMVQELSFLKRVFFQRIPDGYNDPAELSKNSIENL